MKRYVRTEIRNLKNLNSISFKIKNKNDIRPSYFKLLYNKFILTIQKKLVPCHLKNFLLRTTGMKVGHDACVPHDITFDHYFPELITLGEGCLVGGESRLFTHRLEGKRLTVGKVTVEKRALVGGMVSLYPGAKVSTRSIVSMESETDEIIPSGEIWGGRPAKLLQKMDDATIEKYFRKPKGDKKKYYREFREKVRAFVKSKDNFFKIQYDGKRQNAGNDWFRARNIFRIWYNGALIEMARYLPAFWFRDLLYRMAGVKIGKNVKIGKGVVFDHIYADSITVGNDVKIGDHVYIDGHEYTISQTIFGKVHIGKGAVLGDRTYVRTGSTIGENSIIEPRSFVQKEIPPNEIWGGSPAKFIKKNEK